MLIRLLRNAFSRRPRSGSRPASALSAEDGAPAVLNVGGGTKAIPIPAHYQGWRHLLLDIDPRSGADLVCDARELLAQPPHQFDAVYCSHNLEHYFPHESGRVLRGFVHVLKPHGFAEIRVPDIASVMRAMLERGLDIDDVLYQSDVGPILVRDVIYGWHVEIERTGRDFYAHKTGFTSRSLTAALRGAGFSSVTLAPPIGSHEVRAFAFKQDSTAAQLSALGISA